MKKIVVVQDKLISHIICLVKVWSKSVPIYKLVRFYFGVTSTSFYDKNQKTQNNREDARDLADNLSNNDRQLSL